MEVQIGDAKYWHWHNTSNICTFSSTSLKGTHSFQNCTVMMLLAATCLYTTVRQCTDVSVINDAPNSCRRRAMRCNVCVSLSMGSTSIFHMYICGNLLSDHWHSHQALCWGFDVVWRNQISHRVFVLTSC